MAYTKTTWVNGTTPVNATNMNKIEDGIYQNAEDITNLNTDKAPKANPIFTGTPTVPTATAGDSSSQIANTEFVQNELTTSDVTTALTWGSFIDEKKCLAFGKLRIASFKGTQSDDSNITLTIAEIPQGHRTSQLRLVGTSIKAGNITSVCTMNSSTTATDYNKIQINGTGLTWFSGTMIWIVD